MPTPIQRNPRHQDGTPTHVNAVRRAMLFGAIGAGLSLASVPRPTQAAATGFALAPRAGEHLIQRGGDVFINVDPVRGSVHLASGTQQILKGVGIPVHRHFEMDEAFHVLDGVGTFILDDVRHPVEKGSAIFIPKLSWHGFENPDGELHLAWTVTPPGLEAFFREVATRPGVPPVQRTKAEVNEIARRFGTEFR